MSSPADPGPAGGAGPGATQRPDPIIGADLGELRKVDPRDLALRFAFGAAISIVAGLAGSVLGTLIGGLLLAFPAILPATLTLIERKEGLDAAVRDVAGAVLGGVGLTAFAVVAAISFAKVAAPVALLCALGAWVVVSLGLYLLRATGASRVVSGRWPRTQAGK